jgi:hypothetical protein
MSTPIWPTALPQYPTINGYNRTPISSTLEFPVDAGASKERNRATAMPEDVTERYILTTAQKEILIEFWRTTTKRGTQPFIKIQPELKQTRLYKFESPVGSGGYIDGQKWEFILTMRILP